ncbi:hypothetical protein EDB84DRAFT_1439051 [Lactarius hengduanensis]|nr:hypothetical protein EDB84DRAFT_1439051 [Lactarius hengduanensis]
MSRLGIWLGTRVYVRSQWEVREDGQVEGAATGPWSSQEGRPSSLHMCSWRQQFVILAEQLGELAGVQSWWRRGDLFWREREHSLGAWSRHAQAAQRDLPVVDDGVVSGVETGAVGVEDELVIVGEELVELVELVEVVLDVDELYEVCMRVEGNLSHRGAQSEEDGDELEAIKLESEEACDCYKSVTAGREEQDKKAASMVHTFLMPLADVQKSLDVIRGRKERAERPAVPNQAIPAITFEQTSPNKFDIITFQCKFTIRYPTYFCCAQDDIIGRFQDVIRVHKTPVIAPTVPRVHHIFSSRKTTYSFPGKTPAIVDVITKTTAPATMALATMAAGWCDDDGDGDGAATGTTTTGWQWQWVQRRWYGAAWG